MGGMAIYGLGIVLTLTDNISGRLGGVNSSLQQVSQTAMSLNYMGKSLINIGKGMLSPVVGLSKGIIRVGDDMEKTRITFSALYQDADLAEQKINDIINYAAKTPFEIESLKDAAMQFKTLGIEVIGAGSEVKDSTGEVRQLIDIIGDAGAGLSGVARRGFADVVYATREFITEGNKLSFLRRLGVDIDAVLEKGYTAANTLEQISTSAGNTAEERLKAYADLIKALHMDGLMGELSGTWTTMVSNMDDVWYKFLKNAGDSGAFNVFKDGLKSILEIGNFMVDSPLSEPFFKNLGKAFKSLSKPLDTVIGLLGNLVKKFMELGATHPMLLKLALLIPTITGVLFILSGAALMAQSALMLFRYGLMVIATKIPLLLGKLLLLGAIFGAIGYAWSKDMGGIRTRLNNFMSSVHHAFSEADRIAREGTEYMIESFLHLKDEYAKTGDFGTGLTVRLLELKALWAGFVDYWNSPDHSLSRENYDMLERMGLLNTFDKIATWTDRVKAFVEGFCKGFAEMIKSVEDFGKKAINVLGKVFPMLSNGNEGISFDMFSGNRDLTNISGFENFGKSVAKWLPAILGLLKIVKLLRRGNRENTGGGLSGLLSRILGGGNNTRRSGGIINNITRTLRGFGKLSPKVVFKATANLNILITGLALMSVVLGGLTKLVGVDTMVAGVGVLTGIGIALLPLGSSSFTRFIDTLKGLAKTKTLDLAKGIGNLGVIVGLMAGIAFVLGLLVSISPTIFARGAVAFLAMELLLAPLATPFFKTFIKTLQNLAQYKMMTLWKGMRNLGIIVGLMAGITMILGAFASLSPAMFAGGVAVFAAMELLLAPLATPFFKIFLSSLKGLAKIKITDTLKGLANLAILFGGMEILLMAMGGLAMIPGLDSALKNSVNVMGNIAQALGKLITLQFIATVGIIAGLSFIDVGSFAMGLANFAIVVAGVGLIAGLLGAIPTEWGVASAIDRGGEILSAIGRAIGGFVGNLVGSLGGGIIDGFVSRLPSIGKSLATFGDNIKPLFETVKNAPVAELGSFFTSIGKFMLMMAGEGILEAFGGKVQLKEVAEQLVAFTDNIGDFFDKMAEVPTKGINNMSKMFTALGEGLSGYSLKSGGVAQFFTGKAKPDVIAQMLADSAENFKNFFNTAKDFDEAGMTMTTKLFDVLRDSLAGYSLKSGGFAQLMTGKAKPDVIADMLNKSKDNFKNFFNTAKDFDEDGMGMTRKLFSLLRDCLSGYELKSGGMAQLFTGKAKPDVIARMLDKSKNNFKNFFTTAKDFDTGGMNKTRELFELLRDLSNTGLQSGGLAQWGTGQINLKEISKNFKDSAKNFKSFFETANEFNSDGITKANRLMNTLNKLGEAGIASGGFAQLFGGDTGTGLQRIGESLVSFAPNAKTYFETCAGITGGFEESDKVIEALTSLDSIKDIATTFSGGQLGTLGEQLKSFGENAVSFFTSLLGVDTSSVDVVIDALTRFFTAIEQFNTEKLTGVSTGLSDINSSASTLSGSLETLFNTLTPIPGEFDRLGTSVTEFNSVFSTMVTDVQSNSSLVITAVSTMCTNCQGVLSSFASSGYSYGSSLVQNIARGITGNAGAIRSAIQSAVSSAASSVSVKVPISVGHNATGTMNWAGGLTTINERGGELVDLPQGTRIYPHDKSVTMAFDEGMQTAMEHMARGDNDNRQYDDSIHFHAGSIVIQPNGVSEAEAERFAELIMAKIEKKQRRKQLANYAY